jgi:hypothetical protein
VAVGQNDVHTKFSGNQSDGSIPSHAITYTFGLFQILSKSLGTFVDKTCERSDFALRAKNAQNLFSETLICAEPMS